MTLRHSCRLGLLLLICLTRCGDPASSGSGLLRIRLTDAFFPFSFVRAVHLTISKVEVQPASTPGFQTVSDAPRTFDMLSLQEGNTDTLGIKLFSSSFYDAIRLSVTRVSVELSDGRILISDISDSLLANGIVVRLEPPVQVRGDQTTDLIVDFDLPRSLLAEGNLDTAGGISGFSFMPAIRAVDLATVGQITGLIKHNNWTPTILADDTPMRSLPVLIVQAGTTDTVSVVTDELGEYTAFFLPAGTYSIAAIATDSTRAWNIPDVIVTTANTTRQDALMSRQ